MFARIRWRLINLALQNELLNVNVGFNQLAAWILSDPRYV